MTKKLNPKNNSNKAYHKKIAAAYYKKNREKIKAQTAAYRQENLQWYKEYYVDYYLEHSDKIKETAAKWYESQKATK
jgi:hypothetical protein